jgi:hypothetical protein
MMAITLAGNTVVTGDNGIGLLLWSIGTPNGLTTSANTFTGSGVDDIGVYGWVGTAGVPIEASVDLAEISGSDTYLHLRHEHLEFIAQVKGVYHKSQRAELLKKVLELAGPDLREAPGRKNILDFRRERYIIGIKHEAPVA